MSTAKVPIPVANWNDESLVWLGVNEEWVEALAGLLEMGEADDYWDTDDSEENERAISSIVEIINMLNGGIMDVHVENIDSGEADAGAVIAATGDGGAEWSTALQDSIDEIMSSISSIVPVGTIISHLGFPDGYLECNGATIGNTNSGAYYEGDDYRALFDLLWSLNTTNFPRILGENHYHTRGVSAYADWANGYIFALPNLAGRTLASIDGQEVIIGETLVGASVGSKSHTLTTSELPSHTHQQYANINLEYTYSGVVGSNKCKNPTTTDSTTPVNTASTGGGSAHNNLQPTYCAHWLIKF